MNPTFALSRERISSGIATLVIAIGLVGVLFGAGCGYAGNPGVTDSKRVRTASTGTSASQISPLRLGSLAASSASVNFGDVMVGTSTAQLVTLKNTGVANITISTVSATGAGFSASGGSRMTLTPNQGVTVSVNFSPTAAGSVQGTLSITNAMSGLPLQIGLSGAGTETGVQHSVKLSWAPSRTVIGYFIYRGTAVSDLLRVNDSLDQLSSYADNTVVSGQTYFYSVTSVDSNNVESSMPTPISVTIPSP